MAKLAILVLAAVGLGGGIGAGLALRPAEVAEPAAGACPCDCGAVAAQAPPAAEPTAETSDFVKLNNQFVVPVVRESRVAALVVMSVSLVVPLGGTEGVYKHEPKLRDVFLQVLFDHANAGGFDGVFTAGPNMDALRKGLLEAARGQLGNHVLDILITDIARQDY